MESYDVLIIGSGIAGTSCGYHLAKMPNVNFLILEGDDHTGGRTQTLHLDNHDQIGSDVDLGACFIHGAHENPLVYICMENDIKFASFEEQEYLTMFSTNPNFISNEEAKDVRKYYHKIKKAV